MKPAPHSPQPHSGSGRKQPNDHRSISSLRPSDAVLLLARLRELDKDFARQTKQLAALTKRLGRKFRSKD